MHAWLRCTAGAVLCLLIACQRGQKFELPPHIGRGLPEADSLQALIDWLKGQSGYEADTLRLYALFQLIGVISPQNPESGYLLAQQLERLARQSTCPAAQGLSCLGWAAVYNDRAQYDSLVFQARRALTLMEGAGYEGITAQALYLLALGYHQRADYDSALTYYRQACSIREKIGDKSGLAYSYNNIGLIHQEQGRYAEALEHYQRALVLWEAIGDERGLAGSYNNIGNIYILQGRYAEALEYYQKALVLREGMGDKWGLAGSYNNIGLIHQEQGRYAEALEYHQKALALWEAVGDKWAPASSYNNIGSIYQAWGRHSEALEYHQKALALWEAIGDKPGLVESYHNIGITYSEQGRYAEALEYHQKALALQEAIGDQLGLTFSYASIGNLYRQQGRPYLGRPYLLRALAIAQQLNAYDRLREIYLHLSYTDSALAASGQPAYWKSAYEYSRLHTAYKDSVLNKESIRKQAQLESQYEYDKKMAFLKAQQEKERAIAEAEIRRQETQRNLSLLALGLSLISTGIFGALYRTIRRQKRLLQMQAEEIQQKNASLELYNAELKATNQALESSHQVIQRQAEALLEKNEEILDSIRYAERIQRTILPSAERWRKLLPESFLLYLPKDIVAGDFYWLEETERYIFLAIADATGHGVPGAFVSIVCSNALNRVVRQEGIQSPAAILTRAKALVSELLIQEGSHLRDGMDIALVRLDKAQPGKLAYAGANRPLWIIFGEKEVVELSPTRQHVGYTEMDRPFEEVEVDLSLRLPVMLYGFTDGMVDQMGGPKGRKLLSKGLREVLLEVVDLPCAAQAERLKTFFSEWKGEHHQMDDVTLVGVRVG